ncbi:metallophosphoesterase [Siccirubricoccus sp. KC 17139]|uniref:Metallophosphoesterase n=1 Tax=Siccirubricoccus soli TaxID=2899147 RepID=A0ABT1CYG9_9PROT|nr:metallophosphoesterase [Siccirubricoccus soli]MCO6414697.1 metallophosphoesterase [Siccirubricoccus soli]MCP2680827.1 metallophosphoesterase [Siccirubricoccus soli]
MAFSPAAPQDRSRPRGLRRRRLLRWAASLGIGGSALAGYATAWEPGVRLKVVRHRITPPGWPAGRKLSIALIADPHCGGPHTPLARLARAVKLTNAQKPDMVVLLGDYLADHRFVTQRPSMRQVADVLAGLRAPFGVHAILGNHDWWEDAETQAKRAPLPFSIMDDFASAGLPVLHNEVRAVEHGGQRVWVAGLGSQWAYGRRGTWHGTDDLPGTLAQVTDDAPVILLAHEPDIFPRVPSRVAVTLSGHTHGGQIRAFGWSPVVPSRFGNRFAYGAIQEGDRHLVVSGGIGNSIMPVRFGMPPEVTMVELG